MIYHGSRPAKGIESKRRRPPPNDFERRRGMRGLIYHARLHPQDGIDNESKRPLVQPSNFWTKDDIYMDEFRCQWCRLPSDGGPRESHWHHICYGYYACARAFRIRVKRIRRVQRRMVPRIACAECGGSPDTLDHRVPLGLARLLGRRDQVRSYLPENLQWLCLSCADVKYMLDVSSIAGAVRVLDEDRKTKE